MHGDACYSWGKSKVSSSGHLRPLSPEEGHGGLERPGRSRGAASGQSHEGSLETLAWQPSLQSHSQAKAAAAVQRFRVPVPSPSLRVGKTPQKTQSWKSHGLPDLLPPGTGAGEHLAATRTAALLNLPCTWPRPHLAGSATFTRVRGASWAKGRDDA